MSGTHSGRIHAWGLSIINIADDPGVMPQGPFVSVQCKLNAAGRFIVVTRGKDGAPHVEHEISRDELRALGSWALLAAGK